MIFWQKAIISPKATIRDAMDSIADSRCHICIIADKNGQLLGTVTDGDIRRGILNALTLDQPITKIMNADPISAPKYTPRETLIVMMESRGIREVPLVNDLGQVVGLQSLNLHPEKVPNQETWVVVMAGGQGKRLRPFTENIPKPMVRVGARPVLETIIGQLMRHGFRRFFISVNYMADVIINHFGDGSAFGAEIHYLCEDQPLGTAGALSLIEKKMTKPIIVINGDVLNQINFTSLLNFHNEKRSIATMCVRDSEFNVPFGIVNIQNDKIMEITEKPSQKHFINAGVYVLDQRALDHLETGNRVDMTDLFNKLIGLGHKTVAFPVGEYWTDIGSLNDLQKADEDFKKTFSGRTKFRG